MIKPTCNLLIGELWQWSNDTFERGDEAGSANELLGPLYRGFAARVTRYAWISQGLVLQRRQEVLEAPKSKMKESATTGGYAYKQCSGHVELRL